MGKYYAVPLYHPTRNKGNILQIWHLGECNIIQIWHLGECNINFYCTLKNDIARGACVSLRRIDTYPPWTNDILFILSLRCTRLIVVYTLFLICLYLILYSIKFIHHILFLYLIQSIKDILHETKVPCLFYYMHTAHSN